MSAFAEFSVSVPSGSLSEWKAMIEAWEKDDDEPNPFAPAIARTSMVLVYIFLANNLN